jgi:hypothetical protein
VKYNDKDIKLSDIRNKTSSKRKEYSKLYTNGSKKLTIKHDSKCTCIKCRLDPEGGTHKGIKRTELLLD